jgi:predicted DNA-binding transcriptional regulator YafY
MVNLSIGSAQTLNFNYVNWKGESGFRSAIVLNVYFGSSKYHQEPQWLLVGYDLDKKATRTYAMKDMSNVKPKTTL